MIGATAFSSTSLTKWFQSNFTTPQEHEAAIDRLLRSWAFLAVTVHVLAIGDRHNDNLIITSDGRVTQIDAYHCCLWAYRKTYHGKESSLGAQPAIAHF